MSTQQVMLEIINIVLSANTYNSIVKILWDKNNNLQMYCKMDKLLVVKFSFTITTHISQVERPPSMLVVYCIFMQI